MAQNKDQIMIWINEVLEELRAEKATQEANKQ